MTIDTIIVLVKKILDVLLVWAMLYYVLKSLRRNVKMILLFKGVFIIILTKVLSDLLGLVTIGYLIDYIIEWAPLALIVIFQPEIREALENIGKTRILGKHKALSTVEIEQTVNAIVSSVEFMQNNRIGALMVLERNISLANYVKKSQRIYAEISAPLLGSIFYTNNPLHDGGVIISGKQVVCAGTVFPTSNSITISKRLGTRHRAALGIAEQSDCLAIVVSEETGRVSIAEDGELMYNLSLDELRVRLIETLNSNQKLLAKNKKGGK